MFISCLLLVCFCLLPKILVCGYSICLLEQKYKNHLHIFSNSCLYICLLAYCLVCMLFTCLKENQINLHLVCSSCLYDCLLVQFEWYLSNLFAPAVNPFLLTGLFALLINCLPKPGCSKTSYLLLLFIFVCLLLLKSVNYSCLSCLNYCLHLFM